MPLILAVAVLVVLALAPPAAARPGDVDRSFGVRGSVLERTGAGAARALLRPDASAIFSDFSRVVRFTRAGRLDPGLQTSTDPRQIAAGPVIDRQGRLLLVTATYSTGELEHALTRLKPSGATDPSFGDGGSRALPALGGQGTSVTALELDRAGRLLVAGAVLRNRRRRAFVARLLPDGVPDPAFGRAGIVVSGAGTATTRVLVRRNGSLVTSESVKPRTGSEVVRLRGLLASGAIDRSFGRRGFVDGRAGGRRLRGSARLESGAGGSLLLAGPARRRDGRSDRTSTFVARFTRRGRVDRSFGVRGLARLPTREALFNIAFDQDRRGRVVTAGTVGSGYFPGGVVTVQRLRRDGRPDTRFGRRGVVRFLPASRRRLRVIAALVDAVAVRPDGRILIAGTAFDNDFGFRDEVGQPYFALTRLKG